MNQKERVAISFTLSADISHLQSLLDVRKAEQKKLLEDCDHTEVTIQVFDGTEFCSLCSRVVNSVINPVIPRHPYDRDFGDEE